MTPNDFVYNQVLPKLKMLWPWTIVNWMYCEYGENGLILKKEGCGFMWKVQITYVVVLACNQCLSWIGYPHARGTFFICYD